MVLPLPSLVGLTIRPEHTEAWRRRLRGRSREGPAGVAGDGPFGPPQERAVHWLMTNETAPRDLVVSAVAGYGNRSREAGGWEAFIEDPPGVDAVMPQDMTAADVADRVDVTAVIVTPGSRDGLASLECYGECGWDAEHGFRVVLHGDRLVGVADQGSGWQDAG